MKLTDRIEPTLGWIAVIATIFLVFAVSKVLALLGP